MRAQEVRTANSARPSRAKHIQERLPDNKHFSKQAKMPVPVILDTDIGDDIDDLWALAMLLNSPELSLQLVVTAGAGHHQARACIVAKLLDAMRAPAVPIGLGSCEEPTKSLNQAEWAEDYDLEQYAGTIHTDGAAALVDFVMGWGERQPPLTILAIGPLQNVAEALRRQPAIAAKCNFVGMFGSIYRGNGPHLPPAAEFNVKVRGGGFTRCTSS